MALLLTSWQTHAAEIATAGVTTDRIMLFKGKSGKGLLGMLPEGTVFAPCQVGLDLSKPTYVMRKLDGSVIWTCFYDFEITETGRTKIIYSTPDGKWVKGYILAGVGYETFEYKLSDDALSVHFGGSNQPRLQQGLTLYRDKIAFENFDPPEIQNTFIVGGGFDEVWGGLIETLAESQISIETLEKESGILATGVFSDPVGKTMVCPTNLDQRGKVRFNIFAKDLGDSTKVVINTKFVATRDGEVIDCFSNGTIEKWLIEKLD